MTCKKRSSDSLAFSRGSTHDGGSRKEGLKRAENVLCVKCLQELNVINVKSSSCRERVTSGGGGRSLIDNQEEKGSLRLC